MDPNPRYAPGTPSPTFGAASVGALYDPAQLARLCGGKLQCFGDELCSRDWAFLLILKIIEPRHELRSLMRLPVDDP